MRIIFSRKGFDSSYGKCPSPIVDGVPTSLPIPTNSRSPVSYSDIGLGELVEKVTGGRIAGAHPCHHDPYFADGLCAFGQCSSAQGHLRNMGVTRGDVFLFFGLFAEFPKGKKHHRIFGYLRVDETIFLGPTPNTTMAPDFARNHPHLTGDWAGRDANNTLYVGSGRHARQASELLRLSTHEGPVSLWQVPDWLSDVGLTYHQQAWRWPNPNRLQSVAKGQEFVADITDHNAAHEWLDTIIKEIEL